MYCIYPLINQLSVLPLSVSESCIYAEQDGEASEQQVGSDRIDESSGHSSIVEFKNPALQRFRSVAKDYSCIFYIFLKEQLCVLHHYRTSILFEEITQDSNRNRNIPLVQYLWVFLLKVCYCIYLTDRFKCMESQHHI